VVERGIKIGEEGKRATGEEKKPFLSLSPFTPFYPVLPVPLFSSDNRHQSADFALNILFSSIREE
jgi:hypothetical protein